MELIIIGLIAWIGFLYLILNERDNHINDIIKLYRTLKIEWIRRGVEIDDLKRELEEAKNGNNNG